MINANTKEWTGLWGRLSWVRALAKREALLPLALLVAGGWQAADAQVVAPPAAPATPSMPKNKHYMTKSTFSLPVIIDDRVRDNLKEVQLYFKDNETKPWMLMERGTPRQTSFGIRLDRDGEYWFTVVTVDKSNRFTPGDLTNEGPDIVVVQDTTPPQVDARQIPMAAEGVCVRCEIKDANPDLAKTRLEYQTEDKVFRAADIIPGQPDTFVIPAQARFTGMVKATVSDRAGNTTAREIGIPISAAAPNPLPPVIPIAKETIPDKVHAPPIENPGSGQLIPPLPPTVVNSSPRQLPDVLPPAVPPIVPPSVVQPPVVVPPPPIEVTPPDVKPAPPRTSNGGPERHVVSVTKVSLDYQIEDKGPSGVGKVEAWITLDEGKTWKLHCEDKDRASPLDLDLPGEGLYGIRLVVSNGGGFGGIAPKAGETPDWYVEVDKTKPLVEAITAKANQENTKELLIAWKAGDKNFGTEPIEVYFAANREGPWSPVAKGLKNDGRYRWVMPQNVGVQAYLRVVATDRAGNVGTAETPQAVTLDDQSRPRARVLGLVTTPKTPPLAN